MLHEIDINKKPIPGISFPLTILSMLLINEEASVCYKTISTGVRENFLYYQKLPYLKICSQVEK